MSLLQARLHCEDLAAVFMTDLQIYALGHAMVDEEYFVNEEFLQSLGITKHQRNPLSSIAATQKLRRQALAEGKLSLRNSGGSSANTITTAALLGAQCHYSCRLGNDSDGHFVLEQFTAGGIYYDDTSLLDTGHTGLCLVLCTPDSARTMNTFAGVNAGLGAEHINLNALRAAQWVYIAGHLLNSEAGYAAALQLHRQARRFGKKIAINFCDPSVVKKHPTRLTQLLSNPVDLLFCNEEEARLWLSQTKENDYSALRQWATHWAVTEGVKGATLFDGQQQLRINAPVVKAVSTLGAGDMFAGAFLFAIAQQFSFSAAGKLACAAAAELVKQPGARLSRQALKQLLINFQA